MALPNVGEIWACVTTSENDPGVEDEHRYKVVDLQDRVVDGEVTDTDYYAVVRMIGAGAGFRQRIRRSYMNDSAVWSIVSAPIP